MHAFEFKFHFIYNYEAVCFSYCTNGYAFSGEHDCDIANEVGNMGLDIPNPQQCYNSQTGEHHRWQQWQLNYHEAAIFLQEGSNNDKFNTHPRSHDSLPAYEVFVVF